MSPTFATRSRTHHLGFWRRLAAALVCALAVAGCASMRGGVEGDFARAAEQVASAAASSRLSLLTYEQGRNTAAATDTALGDMLEEVDQAASATADRLVDSENQVRERANVLDAADEVTNRIVQGRDIVSGVPGTPDHAAAVAEITAGLAAAAEQLERIATDPVAPPRCFSCRGPTLNGSNPRAPSFAAAIAATRRHCPPESATGVVSVSPATCRRG